MLQSMRERFDYGTDPDKTMNGALIRSYMCDPMTADAEFLLAKTKYKAVSGHDKARDGDVLCYQIRQSFPPGEIDSQTALDIGYELAMRWTKGKHAFFVVAHTDRPHPHVHIYYNAVTLDYTGKYRNFLNSSFALRRLSDRICLEHDLSVITNPKPHSKGKYLHYGQWLGLARPASQKEQIRQAIDAVLSGKPASISDFLRGMEAQGIKVNHGRGGVISFLVPGYERPARWRSSTLGAGYGPEDVKAVIAGKPCVRAMDGELIRPAPHKVNLIIDIQRRMAEGKGPGYAQWAKIYNLKQMAAALQFLQEHGLTDYDALTAKTEALVDRTHTLADELRDVDERLSKTTALMGAVVDYARTRSIFEAYKAARYNRKFLAEHEAELDTYRAARRTINELLDGMKLPKMDELKRSRAELAERRKTLRVEYRAAQREMREIIAVKGNVDYLIGATGGRENKEQER